MNEDPKIETDELITLYLDGEASVRQQTELKRLMQHDPSVAERLEVLRRQQQMLNALPVETAPAGLLEDIHGEIERKLILSDFAEPSRSLLAAGHLLARRLLTAAAMIILPLGLLALVVFQIVKPPSAGPAGYVSTDRMIARDAPGVTPTVSETGIFRELPFNGTLVFKTDQYMAVSRSIEKAIFEEGLLSQTLPSRSADRTRFNITASPKQVTDLMDSLSAIHPQCQSVVLQIAGASADRPIEISDPQIKQVRMLVYEDSPDLLNRLASRYASANQKGGSEFAKNEEQPLLNADGYPQPSIPELASRADLPNRTVRLTIYVERNVK